MLFFVFSDQGLLTTPLEAATLQDVAAQVKTMFGSGLNGDNQTPVKVGVLLPSLTGQVVPGSPATLVMTGDAQTQAQLVSQAQAALTALGNYAGLNGTPTNAQLQAEVKLLTQVVIGLTELQIGKFS